jgi:hypothetical protein
METFGPDIIGSLKDWRELNPTATRANIINRNDLTDDDFVHLQGILYLNMSRCNQPSITNAAFKNLRGIHTLSMGGCNQPQITDDAFSNLVGIKILYMRSCNQAGITDEFFKYLEGIEHLNMKYCDQIGITGKRLYQLGDKLRILDVLGCNKKTIENATNVYGVDDNEITDVQYYHPPPPSEPWKGFTRSDIQKLNTIFEENEIAINYSVCPVCLEHTERSEACMYMKHICNINTRHSELYNKYNNPEGYIGWCTICSRIAIGHRHYKLAYSDNDIPGLEISGDPFAKDCRNQGGGGLPEKLARFRRLREYALELQDDIDVKTKTEALNELIEEVWNAPLRRQGKLLKNIMNKKKWNTSDEKFTENKGPGNKAQGNKAVENTSNAANIAFNGKYPVKKNSGRNNVMMNNNVPILEFYHKQEDNHIETHGIQVETLEGFIESKIVNKEFGTPEFGMCFMYPGKCHARLHPEEIKGHIPDDLYKKYKIFFNRKFSVKKGGSSENIFTEATDAVCSLPTDSGGMRKMTRRRKYLRVRKNKERRKTTRRKLRV